TAYRLPLTSVVGEFAGDIEARAGGLARLFRGFLPERRRGDIRVHICRAFEDAARHAEFTERLGDLFHLRHPAIGFGRYARERLHLPVEDVAAAVAQLFFEGLLDPELACRDEQLYRQRGRALGHGGVAHLDPGRVADALGHHPYQEIGMIDLLEQVGIRTRDVDARLVLLATRGRPDDAAVDENATGFADQG